MFKQKHIDSKPLSVLFFLFIFVIYAVVYMTKTIFSSALAVIVEQGVMTKSETGLINAVFWLVYGIFQVFGGFAADKYSPYKLIMIGLVGSVISNVVIFLNQSYAVIMVAWVFNAAVQFGIWPGIFKIASTQLKPSFRSMAVYWLLFATSFGMGVSLLVASFVKNWVNNFLVSTISLSSLVIIYFFLNRFLDKRMVEEEIEFSDASVKGVEAKQPMLPLALSSGLVSFMFICFFRVAIDNGIKMMTPVMLMETYDTLPAAISTRLSVILIAFSAVGTLVAGFVKKKITENEITAQLILYSVSILPLALVCFIGKIQHLWILLSLSFAIMLVQAASPFAQSFAALRFKKHDRIGTVSGILNATASFGNVFASYVFTKLAETTSWQTVTLSWLITIFTCVFICTFVLPKWTRFIKD